MAIVLGLLAALLYGSADFCGGLATRRSSIFAVTVVSQGTGLVLLASALPFFGGTLSRDAAIFGALGGLCGAIGLALLYHALSIGKMGVVSPITAILAAAVPVGIGVARGEHFSPWQAVGMAAALVAVALISLSHEPDGRFEFSTVGVKEAVASGIVLGGFYTFMALAGKHAGLYPLLSARLASTLFLVLAAIVARQTIVPVRSTAAIVMLAGALDMSANALYLFATYAGYLSVAAVLTSLYPASTVFLARLVLRERLAWVQKIGVALALAGVALIAA